MTELLISVRSPTEFNIADQAGIRFIDVKEPEHGSLGAASIDVLRTIVAAAKPHHKVSVALGELLDDQALAAEEVPARTDFAKVGLAGCLNVKDWQQRLQKKHQALHPHVDSVAVAYADWQLARSPRIDDVFQAGLELGCSAFLIDTFDKSRGNLLAHLSESEIFRWIERGRRANKIMVVAGSLDQSAMRQLQPLSPTVMAVRSAACRGDRTQNIDADFVSKLCEICSSQAV
ncbi:MAG: (5-formylfuran-3-yl)methyl phosphate synthase [Pirellulaceae bacterium]|nr:(5-formylfuran-3-yl)methyl phosphate synthase [Pirellulaceae bacterium]